MCEFDRCCVFSGSADDDGETRFVDNVFKSLLNQFFLFVVKFGFLFIVIFFDEFADAVRIDSCETGVLVFLLKIADEVRVILKEWENRLKIEYQIFDATSNKRLTKGFTSQVAVNMETREMCFQSPQILIDRLNAWSDFKDGER